MPEYEAIPEREDDTKREKAQKEVCLRALSCWGITAVMCGFWFGSSAAMLAVFFGGISLFVVVALAVNEVTEALKRRP